MKDKNCLITRTTRTQCQYCRYAKCIQVGMKLSGKELCIHQTNDHIVVVEGSPNLKIEDIFKQIPCAVCHHASSGIHFGATTCEVKIHCVFFSIKFLCGIAFRDVKVFFVGR